MASPHPICSCLRRPGWGWRPSVASWLDSLTGVRAGLAAGMQVWRFVGGSHFAGLDLSPDPEAVPHRVFASFEDFFHFAPGLKEGQGNDGQNGRR